MVHISSHILEGVENWKHGPVKNHIFSRVPTTFVVSLKIAPIFGFGWYQISRNRSTSVHTIKLLCFSFYYSFPVSNEVKHFLILCLYVLFTPNLTAWCAKHLSITCVKRWHLPSTQVTKSFQKELNNLKHRFGIHHSLYCIWCGAAL